MKGLSVAVYLLLLPLPSSAKTKTATTTSSSMNVTPSQPPPPPPPPPSSRGYSTLPSNISVAAGYAASFRCGMAPPPAMPRATPLTTMPPTMLTFTLSSSRGNHTISCPQAATMSLSEQAVKGYCETEEDGEVVAVWRFTEASYTDDNTRMVCEAPGLPQAHAFLNVYDGSYFTTLIGCVIGGFFGILLVFGLSYTGLRRSERFQRCFTGGRDQEDDLDTMVTKQ